MSYISLDATAEHRKAQHGFEIGFDLEYQHGSGGVGFAKAYFNHVDEQHWDVPEITISFEDTSSDYTGLLICTQELIAWLQAHQAEIDLLKKDWLNS